MVSHHGSACESATICATSAEPNAARRRDRPHSPLRALRCLFILRSLCPSCERRSRERRGSQNSLAVMANRVRSKHVRAARRSPGHGSGSMGPLRHGHRDSASREGSRPFPPRRAVAHRIGEHPRRRMPPTRPSPQGAWDVAPGVWRGHNKLLRRCESATPEADSGDFRGASWRWRVSFSMASWRRCASPSTWPFKSSSFGRPLRRLVWRSWRNGCLTSHHRCMRYGSLATSVWLVWVAMCWHRGLKAQPTDCSLLLEGRPHRRATSKGRHAKASSMLLSRLLSPRPVLTSFGRLALFPTTQIRQASALNPPSANNGRTR